MLPWPCGVGNLAIWPCSLGHVELATWQHGLLQLGQCGLCYLVKYTWQAIQVNFDKF